MAEIKMPQLGETVTEGTITKWFKAVGDQVSEDEILFEVSTDKVDSEVPSPVSGYLTEIRVQEGETVDVGVTLAVVGDQAAGGGEAASPATPEAAAPEEPAPAETPATTEEATTEEATTEEATTDQALDAAEADGAESAGEGREPAVEETPAPTAEVPAPAAPAPAPPTEDGAGAPPSGESRLLSPVVRRLITEHDLDPATIPGTGAGGRITRSDVLALIESADGGGTTAAAAAKVAAPAAEAAPAEAAPAKAAAKVAPSAPAVAGERDEVVPFTNIRRRTAEHMVRSKATSAHTLIVTEVDYDGLERVRQPAREGFRAEEGIGLTYLPFVSRAVVDAIRDFPHVNASVGDDELIVHHDVHLSIAVDIDFEGLVAPVVHGADGKRLRALAREIADLAARARSKKLGPDDISGGTFTITNAGPYGTFITAAIINQPQVAILATDGVKKRPVVIELPDGSDAIAVHPTGMLALTFDHRAFDGAYAAAFLARVKEIVETRDWAAELT